MRPADEHSHWDEDLAAYAIGALAPHEMAAFAAHVATCDRCRGELHRLSPAIELLPASVEQLDPPPALRGRIMAAVEADLAARAAVAPADAQTARPDAARAAGAARERPDAGRTPPSGSAGWRQWAARVRGWRIPALPAATTAGALCAAFAIGFAVRGGEDGARSVPGTSTSVAAVGLRPGTPVQARLRADEAGAWRLDVARLPPLRAGRVYETWVMRSGASAPEPSTLFVLSRDGTSHVVIPQSLRPGDQVLVTDEPAGGSSAPTSRPLLQAQV